MKYEETENAELKRNLNEYFVKSVVSFLNSHNGTIYIGVENDGIICGVEKVDEVLKKISDIITTDILPNPQELIKIYVILENNQFVIQVKIKKGNSLYYIKKYGRSVKGCYIRVGTNCRSMTEEQIENAFISSLQTNDPLTIIPTLYSPITFRQLKIYYEYSKFHLNEKTFEKKLNLKNKEGKYNKLAELLSDTNRVGLIYARFNGTDKSCYGETIDHGNQCLITSIEKMKNRLEAENFGMSKITFSKRIDKQLVDMDCLREALYNAVAHNDWENSRIPIIYKFSDRFEIISYGGIPNGQTKEKFLKGISKPRSESLMRVLRDLGYAERKGQGIIRIVNKYGTKAFTFGDDYIIVTLPFDKEVYDSFSIYNKKQKNNNIKKILLEQISNNNKITMDELATILSVSKKTIRYHIDILRNKGQIKRIGSNRGGEWVINHKQK